MSLAWSFLLKIPPERQYANRYLSPYTKFSKKMEKVGQQYSKDDKTDPTGFLRRARLHQSKFRAFVLNLPYDTYGNYLTENDAKEGKNFYDGFGIFDAVKNFRKYNKPLYANMLRSEHIPFNLLAPLNLNKNFFKNIFNDFLGNKILSIDKIIIEYAPKPKEKYLNDGTSFDAYIEYTHIDNFKGIIGIEIKYTEKEYRLKANSKQEKDINNKVSKYYSVTEKCNIYKSEAVTVLPTNKFRQIWRNQLLGESILLVDADQFKHFTSLTIYPKDNKHFIHTCQDYINLLINNDNKFLALTYEDFLNACNKHCPDDNYKEWIEYLTKRYIVQEEQ